jgi:hypothetical protein
MIRPCLWGDASGTADGLVDVDITGLDKGTDYCVYTALSPGSGDAIKKCFSTDDIPTAGPFTFSS